MTYFCYLIAFKKCLSLQYNSIVSVYGCKDTHLLCNFQIKSTQIVSVLC
nr:MAG TPA: hypothetical protein [Caudoviricetes sp.]